MNHEKRRLIDIDEIQRQLSVEQVADFYGIELPPNFGNVGEQRMACPCRDCKGHDDPGSVSVNLSDPVKRWKCHGGGYGCGAQGRLVMLAYCMKHGSMPASGRLAGKEFMDIAKDLESVAEGRPRELTPPPIPTEQTRAKVKQVIERPVNKPLAESDNANARGLVKLDKQLITDLSQLSPDASAYARRHSFLLSPVEQPNKGDGYTLKTLAEEVRCGYMPGSSKSSLRGKWVYGVMNRSGEPLAWISRNVKYEREHKSWIKEGRRGREPVKYRFPNKTLFQRGLELYGQEWLDDPRFAESLDRFGIILTEGFNDRIRLHQLGVLSLSMMSNKLTDAQSELLVQYATEKADGRVGIMHDANIEGDAGAKESLWRLSVAGLSPYLIWSREKDNGTFKDREPESLSEKECDDIAKTTPK